MNSFFRSSLFSAALAGGLTAQTAPKPAAPAHDHAPVALDQFVTSATPFKRNQVDLAQSTTVLAGRSLLLKQQPTLGATLGGETGISESYYGPGSSRPIVRGLDGERVRILENGLALLDASANSPDHAVAVEPFLVERIEDRDHRDEEAGPRQPRGEFRGSGGDVRAQLGIGRAVVIRERRARERSPAALRRHLVGHAGRLRARIGP